ncbi:hypothetical protein A8L59_16665 [Pseudomonas koreensis]|uniref:Uncharacterized protein n=1 Tax=Pseudomonas koreensis TaxID=198620 RepID=A0AAC9BW57_9PSED|nr:hypothetical protein [Pseudomonas koreensis]ANH98978.1 hypothetical protein A8L59_16665 [Pseudomonas koreensis]
MSTDVDLGNQQAVGNAGASDAQGFFSARRLVLERAEYSIRAVLNNLPQDEDGKRRFQLIFLIKLLGRMKNQSDLFDARCSFNIGFIGESFFRDLDKLGSDDFSNLGGSFSMGYRFLIEFQLMSPGELPDDLASIAHQVADFEFSGNVQLTIKYAEHQMIIQLLSRYIHHPNMVELKRLPKAIADSVRERTTSEELLSDREKRVNVLKEKLDKYKQAFNFVGLNEGFRRLRVQKRVESLVSLSWLFLLGTVMLSPPVYKMYCTLFGTPEIKVDTYFALTVLGFELLLAYFFRVGLHGYRAIKAQLIQIDLRMALCQFIQEYANYAKGIRKESPELLDRFDQLIFSGIVNSEGAIPSTFDGLDHVANLLDKLKSK